MDDTVYEIDKSSELYQKIIDSDNPFVELLIDYICKFKIFNEDWNPGQFREDVLKSINEIKNKHGL